MYIIKSSCKAKALRAHPRDHKSKPYAIIYMYLHLISKSSTPGTICIIKTSSPYPKSEPIGQGKKKIANEVAQALKAAGIEGRLGC